jgi:TonB-linked SusC/RagA family outer membrane protein
MKKLLVLFLALALAVPFANAQERNVSGKITSSEDGLPVVGATVQDKTAGTYAVSDAAGAYSIRVSSNSKSLTVICLGFKDMVVPITGTKVNVTMEPDVLSIDETMVVAYGQGKKSTFTGSATKVKREDIERIPTSNVASALQGLSTGVQVLNNSGQPGDGASIIIRGIGSMNASSSPLWVVDGVPYAGYINAIATSDIESMTVLKDATATALYGSRAANGVIVVTTKQGRSEEGKITFRSNLGFSHLAVDLPRQITPQEYTEMTWNALYYEAREAGSTAEAAAQQAMNNTATELKINPWSTALPVGADGKLLSDTKLLFSGDWRNETMKSRPRQEYSVDLSGKSGNTDYYFSGAYVDDKGIFTTQQFNRVTGRANVNTQIKKWLTIGTNTSFSHSMTDAPASENVVWFLRTMPSIYPIYEWDYSTNSYKTDAAGNKIYDYGDSRIGWSGWNVLADAKYNKSVTDVDNISTRDYAEITFIPELKFKSTVSIDYYLNHYSGYTTPDYGFMIGRGSITKQYDRSVAVTSTNLLTFNKSIGSGNLGVMLGEESYQRNVHGMWATREGLPFGGLYELSSAATMTGSSSYTDNYRLLSFFSRAEYDFMNKYYVSASLRTDGSSRFAKSSRWGTFWSVGASWRMSNEEFLKGVSWIDNLKLKASYGAVGNDGLSSWYCYQGLYATGYNDYSNPGIMISRLPNENLKWETNLQMNVGVEFSLFRRLSGSFEYFDRRSKDLLFTMPMAPSTGFGGIDRNIGDVMNNGVEMQLDFIAFNTPDFKWSIDLNATHYENKITKLPQKEMNAGYFKWREGRSRYDFWGAEYAGVNPKTGNDQYWKNVYETKEDGTKVVTDRVLTESTSDVTGDDQKAYLGVSTPDLFGAVTNTFNFFGVDFSFMVYYSLGGKLYDSDYSQMMTYRQGFSFHPDVLNSWTEGNTASTISKFYKGKVDIFSSKYLYDNTFVRLRNVTLGYTLPSALLKKMHFDNLRIYVQGDNLMTWGTAAKRGTDPEQDVSGTTYNRFPTTKSVSFGVQFTF